MPNVTHTHIHTHTENLLAKDIIAVCNSMIFGSIPPQFNPRNIVEFEGNSPHLREVRSLIQLHFSSVNAVLSTKSAALARSKSPGHGTPSRSTMSLHRDRIGRGGCYRGAAENTDRNCFRNKRKILSLSFPLPPPSSFPHSFFSSLGISLVV